MCQNCSIIFNTSLLAAKGSRAVGRSENLEGAGSIIVGRIWALVGLGLTDMTKTGGGSWPPALSVFTALHSHRVRPTFSATRFT